MLKGKKISVVMAAGRRRYLPIISKYILEEPCIDEWQLWLNTKDQADIEYMYELASWHQDKIRLVHHDEGQWGETGSMGAIRNFYGPGTIEPDTVYLRVDDDIVHVHDHALRTLAEFRINNPHYFLITANMVNSGLCSHLQHRMGCHVLSSPHMDAPAWSSEGGALHWSSNMATVIHHSYLKDLKEGRLDRWRAYERWELYEYPRFGIACCSFFGKDFLEIIDKWQGEDDEIFVTEIWPRKIKRMNCIAGNALISHYAYGPQRDNGFETRADYIKLAGEEVYPKDILNRYRQIAGVPEEPHV
jgi:hypothetical protein